MFRSAVRVKKPHVVRQPATGQVSAPLGRRWQNSCIPPRRLGEVGIVLRPLVVFRVDPNLNLAQSTHTHLCPAGYRNRFTGLGLFRLEVKPAHGFHPAVNVIIAAGIGVVGLVIVGEHNALEPLDRFEAIGIGHQHPHRATPFAGKPLAIELVTEDHWVVAR